MVKKGPLVSFQDPNSQVDNIITTEIIEAAEQQIDDREKIVDYTVREYPIETIIEKFSPTKSHEDPDEFIGAEFFIPDYQREMYWEPRRQSRFIESILIGLPIPFMFLADVNDPEGRLEIVDGTQRIRTLVNFRYDNLVLDGLKKLDKLNGFRFSDLPLARKRRFLRKTIRIVELTQKADQSVRQDLFDRINTGSVRLQDMDRRYGSYPGPFGDFITSCINEDIFKRLIKLPELLVKKREPDEYALRFFAYLNARDKFSREVEPFLTEYWMQMNDLFNQEPHLVDAYKAEILRTFEYVEKYLPDGFRKSSTASRVYRVRYEAIAVGTALALREKPDMGAPQSTNWLFSKEFMQLTTSDASNSKPKLEARIGYVKNKLLGDR